MIITSVVYKLQKNGLGQRSFINFPINITRRIGFQEKVITMLIFEDKDGPLGEVVFNEKIKVAYERYRRLLEAEEDIKRIKADMEADFL